MYINRRHRQDKRLNAGSFPIVLAVTPAFGWVFFEGLIEPIRAAGLSPILVSAPGEQLRRIAQAAGSRYEAIPLVREISPGRDLLSLWRFYRLMRKARPVIADVGTPKAGLLGGLAALLAGVPCRVYTLRGLRLETTTGWRRKLLSLAERIACACAHRVICVGPSLRDRAVELKLVPASKTVVLANGSCGINVDRFSPNARRSAARSVLAAELKIPSGVPVIGFVGRFTRDKGIPELVAAFSKLRQHQTSLRLLLVGDFEDGDPVPAVIRKQIESDGSIVRTGFVSDTAPYYGLMDVFVLPTHREGFGEVSLEAQASGVPVVTTMATGVIDSVVDGVTGFLVPVGDSHMLATRIGQLLQDANLRGRMGQAGREWVVRQFRQEIVAQALVQEYRRISQSKGILLSSPPLNTSPAEKSEGVSHELRTFPHMVNGGSAEPHRICE
jgi:glycosyltransferase involved in cell wall biosynthesis